MNLKHLVKKVRVDQEPSQKFRANLKASLVAYLKNNPPAPNVTLVASHHVPAPFWHKGLAISFAALLIVCTGAVGTVFAAERALPGNPLYGVKLAVDQLSVAISNSPEARIAVADRRLQEVKQVLNASSSQNVQVQADIQKALQEYQSNLQNAAASISAKSIPSASVQTIIRKTTENQNDLKQLLSENATSTIAPALKNSLQSSEETVTTVRATLEHPGDNPSSSTSAVGPRNDFHETIRSSSHQSDTQRKDIHNATGTSDQKNEDHGHDRISVTVPTSTMITSSSSSSWAPSSTKSQPEETSGSPDGSSQQMTAPPTTTVTSTTITSTPEHHEEDISTSSRSIYSSGQTTTTSMASTTSTSTDQSEKQSSSTATSSGSTWQTSTSTERERGD